MNFNNMERGDDVTKMAPQAISPEAKENIDFSKCLNIEELYALVDVMEKGGIVISGNVEDYTAGHINQIIADVRRARAQNMEKLAQDTLLNVTRKNGLREAIDRIVHGDSIVGLRDKRNKEGVSTKNFDINL